MTAATRFELPADLSATAPPTSRDGVRLLVATPFEIRHRRFTELPAQLRPGDLLVVNTSATLPAAVSGTRADGRPVTVHFATPLRAGDDGDWVVELRPGATADGPVPDVRAGELVTLPDGVPLHVIAAQPAGQRRLWHARLAVEDGVVAFLSRRGRPIRYSYVPAEHPLADYQTVFAADAGSAEMPSAGRPLTAEAFVQLAVRGVAVAPVTLHTGVSSPEAGEPPQPERYRVPVATARLVNATRSWGGRVVAVGTTVTRALESAADADGTVRGGAGWTDLVLGPDRPARVVSGLVTGWHAPGASHLQLLEAVAGGELVERAYRVALRERYLWHEFGDSCLLLP